MKIVLIGLLITLIMLSSKPKEKSFNEIYDQSLNDLKILKIKSDSLQTRIDKMIFKTDSLLYILKISNQSKRFKQFKKR